LFQNEECTAVVEENIQHNTANDLELVASSSDQSYSSHPVKKTSLFFNYYYFKL